MNKLERDIKTRYNKIKKITEKIDKLYYQLRVVEQKMRNEKDATSEKYQLLALKREQLLNNIREENIKIIKT